jgi:thymidylate synthase
MVQSITAKNVNDAVINGLWWLRTSGSERDSRNGRVIVSPCPVAITYLRPDQRVLFWPERDANPFFHLLECIWMLAGRNDARWISQFNERMNSYAESNGKFHGAYGYRWRRHWFDQLEEVADLLERDPNTRRCVVGMWDPAFDLNMNEMKDLPCNTHIYFSRAGGRLDMTVCNRSNDAIWGAHGANAVHMSFLQQVFAEQLEIPMGKYIQFSNDYHLYIDQHKSLLDNVPTQAYFDQYVFDARPVARIMDVDQTMSDFLDQCVIFVTGGTPDNKFLREVAGPMKTYYIMRKELGRSTPRILLENMPACDWRMAALDWVERRDAKSE